ncbi:MAG: cadherin-like beta sandwich domain-containing protein [Nitrospira sp.]|nr:cadherin-like beta sandwich domain-containing protein [Nitrospira sp.]MDI3466592.1 hypothetical protein [Nitrospira sp.]
MRWNRICLGQRFITVLLLAIGLSSYGCKDSISISEDVQVPLASLTVTPGTLQPGFFSNTTNYTFNAPTSADKVTVTAIPRDNTATVTINNAVTTHLSVPLGAPGSTTTITIALSSSTGTESTYTVTVTRLLSSDNNLSALSVTQGTLKPSPFDANTLDYTVDVQTGVPSVTVTATKSDANATMLIGSVTVPAGTNPGQAPITLSAPGTTTPVSIEVTAPNGSKKTYNLSIKRLSGDINLSALSVTANSLAHPVDLNTPPPYTVNVATDVISVDVSATKSDPNAVMAIGSVTVPAGTASGSAPNIPLGAPGSDTPISIIVTAQNGVDSKTYTVTVHRATSDDSNLSALSVTANSLAHPVDLNTPPLYTVNVATDVISVDVSATKSDPNAVMAIGSVTVPAGTASGSAPNIPLGAPGSDTPISIIVTAQNGVDSKTYTVTVHRATSDDSNLSALSVAPGSLDPSPFDPSQVNYTVNVDNSVNSVVLTATKSDPQATMSALGSVIAAPGVPDGQVSVTLLGATTEVVITVIAQDMTSETRYTITVNQAP